MKTRYQSARFHWARYACLLLIALLPTLSSCGAAPLPPAPKTDAGVRAAQERAFVEAMAPRRSGKPVIAVLALNEGTETTDFLLTHGLLQRSGVARVQAVAPRRGSVQLYPALQVEVAQDLAGFDREHPSGADYVIVPAMSRDDDPAIAEWLRQQASRGARIISVCAGAKVLGQAGLLDGRRFVTHWYFRPEVVARHPEAVFVPNLRYVADRDVGTTTGITASLPAMLALVEAIGGRARAEALAAELGMTSWGPDHDSSPFVLTLARKWDYVLEKAAFWRDERWGVDVQDGLDDIALALTADAWARTGRVNVEAVSGSGPVRLRSGLLLAAGPAPADMPRVPQEPSLRPVPQLDRTLCEIGERFGAKRQEWVMLELEYPWQTGQCLQ